MTSIPLALSLIAIIISLWSRIETYSHNNRQRKIELAKRVGEALVTSQILKNTLSDNIDSLKDCIANGLLVVFMSDSLVKLEKEYQDTWNYVQLFESIIGELETGKFVVGHDQSIIEAKIAHFNQRKVLAEFDIAYLNKKVQSQIESHSRLELPSDALLKKNKSI